MQGCPYHTPSPRLPPGPQGAPWLSSQRQHGAPAAAEPGAGPHFAWPAACLAPGLGPLGPAVAGGWSSGLTPQPQRSPVVQEPPGPGQQPHPHWPAPAHSLTPLMPRRLWPRQLLPRNLSKREGSEACYSPTLGSRGAEEEGQWDRGTQGPRLTVRPGPGQVVIGTQGAHSSGDAQC